MSIDGNSDDSHEYLTYSQRFSHEIVMTLFLEIFSQTRTRTLDALFWYAYFQFEVFNAANMDDSSCVLS